MGSGQPHERGDAATVSEIATEHLTRQYDGSFATNAGQLFK
jgi:hypothetical protein